MSDITIVSLNVRGLGNNERRRDIFSAKKEKVFYLHAARGSLY